MDVLERARAYVAKCPPAVSGQRGHDTCFTVATALVHGFCLDFSDAMALMTEYNDRCQPQWNEHELHHKIRQAEQTAHEKPRGWLLGDQRRIVPRGKSPTMPPPRPPPPSVERKSTVSVEFDLPELPVEDGACVLLCTAFEAGEGVRIVPAVLNDEGREIPEGNGAVLSREEWLRKLSDRDGNPNRIWRSPQKTGIYIAINPLKPGATKDADVTSFRHTLLEFDEGLSIEEQWNLYLASRLPCTAVIHSGGKSVHAWVRVDARDRREYDERVKILYEHFAPYGVDGKNKNPSRLSRLPNCVRFDGRQELLASKIGLGSFSEWLTEMEVASLGQEMSVSSLLGFDSLADSNAIVGANRWLCRGGSCMIIGPSGVGKSSLMVQMAVLWALGRGFCGVGPVTRALKSLIVQNENDLGDSAEMLQGVLAGVGGGGGVLADDAAIVSELKKNLVIIRERTHVGSSFLGCAQRLIERHRPDLVWVDPLYCFIGDDINSPKAVADFLGGGLGPITEATGVCWMFMHHTGKPSVDPRSKRGWTSTDYSYAGLGASTLTNWVRATMTLIKRDENLYELQLGKRGGRAGALDITGAKTKRLWLAHSDKGICWQQVAEPSDEEKLAMKNDSGGGGDRRHGKGRPKVEFDSGKFLAAIRGEHIKYSDCINLICEQADCSERKAKEIFKSFRDDLVFDEIFKTFTSNSK